MSKPTFAELPVELLEEIYIFLAGHDYRTSILNLTRTCRVLRNVTTRFLYCDIDTSDWPYERMDLLMRTLWPLGPLRSFVRRLHFHGQPGRTSIESPTRSFYMENFLYMTENLQVFHLNMKGCSAFPRKQRRVKMKALRHIILENLHIDHGRVLDFIKEAPQLEVLTMRNYWYEVKSGLLTNLKCLELIDLDSARPGSDMLDELLLQCPQLESLTLTTERDSSYYYFDPTKVVDISIMLSLYRNTLRHLKILWQCCYCQAIGSLRDFTCLETVVIGFHDRRSWIPGTPLVDFLRPTVQSVTLDLANADVFKSMQKMGEAKQQGLFPSLQSFTHSSHYVDVELAELSRKYGMRFRTKRDCAFDIVAQFNHAGRGYF